MKQKIFFMTLGLLLAHSSANAQQGLKIASVSMEKLFNDYYETAAVQREINIERARIQKENNERLSSIRDIDAQLQKIREDLKNEKLGQQEKNELTEKSSELAQTGIQKERERSDFLTRGQQRINEKMGKQMRSILSTIQRAVSDRAKAGNYDYIFDASGTNSQGATFVLYARDSTDLTSSILEEINANKPAEKKEETQ